MRTWPERRDRGRFVSSALVALSLALLIVPAVGGLLRSPARAVAGSDFAAFYCAGRVALHGADPYRLEPLKTCEVEQAYAPGGIRYESAGIDPAPFPPYFFVALAPLATLEYGTAAVLWHLSILLASGATVWCLAGLTRLAWWKIAPAIFLAVFEANFSVGQLPPLIICALAAAALLLDKGRTTAAAIVAAVSVLEPHVGLPVLAALFVWRAAARIPLAAAAGVALGSSFVVPGAVRLWPEYLGEVLPVHAVAEAPVWIQMSATWLLRFGGVDDGLAARLGFWQYALVTVAAVAFAGPLARRLRSPAALICLPAAAAVFGGTFIHYGQITLALLPAFFLVARTRSVVLRRLLWLAIVLVAVSLPGRGFGRDVPLVLCLLASAVGACVSDTRPRLIAFVSSAGAMLVLALVVARLPASGPSAAATIAGFQARGFRPDLASTVMGLEWRRTPAAVTPSWRRLAEKLPVWLGLGCILAAGLRFAVAGPTDASGRAQTIWRAGRSRVAKRRRPSLFFEENFVG